MRNRVKAPIALLLSFTCGCFTTRHVQSTTPVAQTTTESGVVVTAKDGNDVRIDPNTELRFRRADGTISQWFKVSELVVSEDGVLRQGTSDGMYWSDIVDVEAKNFSGAKTLGVIAISAAVVAVVVVAVAVVAAGGKGGGGGGRGSVKPAGGGNGGLGGWNTKGGSSSGGGNGSNGGGSSGGNGGNGGGNGGSMNGGGSSGGIYISPHYHSPYYYSNGPQPTIIRPEKQTLGTPNFAIPDPAAAQPMFTQDAERMAKAKIVASVEGTSEGDAFNPAAAPSAGAAAVVRVGETIEIGGGFRQMLPTRLSGPETIGFFRFNLNLNLDQRHLFAIPIGVDAGTNFDGDAFLTRINLGLRLQVTQNVGLGVFPVNPTYFENRTGFGWGFPSSAELSFSF